MIVSLSPEAQPDEVRRELAARGLWVGALERSADGKARQFVIGSHSVDGDPASLSAIPGVQNVSVAASAHPRMDAQGHAVLVAGVLVGGPKPVIMAGPCAVESEAQIHAIAERVARQGATFLRGGAFKPRTSPYSFQGRGPEALPWMRRAADACGLHVVTEVVSEADVPIVKDHADLLQVGSRNMQNTSLLRAIGQANRPVLLKRAMAATVEEWLLAGEYLLVHGAPQVVLCERGIRSFDPATRNLLDLGTVALLSHVRKIPVIVDPSHAAGRRDLIPTLARAAIAAGACGLMIETHDDPGSSMSDGPQALGPADFEALVRSLPARCA